MKITLFLNGRYVDAGIRVTADDIILVNKVSSTKNATIPEKK
ncbi:hypothetical protein [Liquorilactobacillus sucicola]|nr:hypothetical protein [Liquorilactobacillus sucicola]